MIAFLVKKDISGSESWSKTGQRRKIGMSEASSRRSKKLVTKFLNLSWARSPTPNASSLRKGAILVSPSHSQKSIPSKLRHGTKVQTLSHLLDRMHVQTNSLGFKRDNILISTESGKLLSPSEFSLLISFCLIAVLSPLTITSMAVSLQLRAEFSRIITSISTNTSICYIHWSCTKKNQAIRYLT